MPSVTIPFVGSFNIPLVNYKSTDGAGVIYKGQRFYNCIFNVIKNAITNTGTATVEKRPGFARSSQIGTTATQDIFLPAFSRSTTYYGFSSSNWDSATTCSGVQGSAVLGQVSGNVKHISGEIIGSYGTITVNSTDGTAYFYQVGGAGGSTSAQLSGSPSLTNGSPVITNIGDTSVLQVGQNVTCGFLPAATYVVSIDSSSQITVSQNATITANVAVTKFPLIKIMSANFPSATAVGGFAFLDGYAFIMTTAGRVYNSALNDLTTWGASDYLTANMDSDGGVGCVRYKNQIIAFGSNSGEFFYNAGNASSSVLGRAESQFFKIGASSSYAICSMEDTIFWVGISSSGGFSVYVLNGFTPKKISTPEIEAILNHAVTQGYGYFDLRAVRIAGRSTLFLSPSTGGINSGAGYNVTLLFDIELNLWHGWYPADSDIYFNKIAFDTTGSFLVTGGATGYTYKCYFGNFTYKTDGVNPGGTAVTMDIYTKRLNFGSNNRKFIKKIQLNCDQFSSGSVSLSCSDVESESAETFTGGPTGTFDCTLPDPQVPALGSFVGSRAFRFSHTTENVFRAESFTVEYDMGVH